MDEKPYTIRRLTDDDMWQVLPILGKVIPDDLAPVFQQLMSKEKSLDEVGSVVAVRLVAAIMKNMPAVKADVYAFLSSVTGLDADTIKGMEIGTTPQMLWDIIAVEKNANFFKAVSRLL